MRKHMKKISSFVLALSLVVAAVTYSEPAMAANGTDTGTTITRNGSSR